MHLKHLKTIASAENVTVAPLFNIPSKVVSITWAPNNSKLAYATADGVVHIVDETGEKRDTFSTKPVDTKVVIDTKYAKKNYFVSGIAFSPDSTKIAVAQSDNVVFVYKIGEEWGEKKSICNKFIQATHVTCMIWLAEGPIIFGLSDGNVRSALIKSTKTHALYASHSYVVSLASNHRGTGFLSGHADGSIVRYFVTDDVVMEKVGRICTHSTSPYVLAWPTGHIIAAGSNKRITVYKDGQVAQSFDYFRDQTEKDFTTACCSPSGQAVVIAGWNRLRVFSWKPSKKKWEENTPKEIKNAYSICALAWKRDGSRIVCGTLCGAVELFESVLKRLMWKDKFELTFVGPSQVNVRPQAPGVRGLVLKSKFGYEIDDLQIMGKDRYLIARTPETILLADLHKNHISEVVWVNSGQNEKFYLDHENVCLIFNAGELSLVEYGQDEVLGSVRTEFMNPHLISVRLNERKLSSGAENKKLAYLLDLKTIAIMDLVHGTTISQVIHDYKIDWLELNETGQKLLYRDRTMKLTLFDVGKNQKTTLLDYCTFVQWVPNSDVAVAQARSEMCVWYNIDSPDQVTLFSIKGDIVDVIREDGKTEVLVQEGFHQLGYELDEGLVEFGTALHDNDFGRAISFLETLGNKPEAEGMWTNLASIALGMNKLEIAERCYAALGDVAKTYHIKKTRAIAEEFTKTNGVDGLSCPEVWARLAILNHQPHVAEAIYLEQNQIDKAIAMYQKFHKWDQALALAESRGHPNLQLLREQHFKWLMETKQEERAGEEKERNGELDAALQLYLKANLPTRASRLIQSNSSMLGDEDLVERVASILLRKEMLQQAGELYEKAGQTEKAFNCYRQGKAFSRAIELARYVSPAEVVGLEEQWGDHLVTSKQMDAAINHYIEAGKTVKALDAAVGARQWKKAIQIIQVIEDPKIVLKHYAQLGQHFALTKEYKTAEQLYTQAGMYNEAIEMYNQAGEWEAAHRLAQEYLSTDQAASMYWTQAQALEEKENLREAEKLYISVGQPDAAISMYKKHKQYEHMMRLVSQHHPDLVQTTHLHLAQELEAEGNLRSAEQHYLAAGEWKGAVNMYRLADKWEDAYKIAKSNGGAAAQQVAFLWAKNVGGEAAVKLLIRLNLLETSIDYACEVYQFDFAFELAQGGLKSKLPDVHYKHAMALEDDGKFREAEEEFISAGRPKEAVHMYIHCQDWENATRVAEVHDSKLVPEIMLKYAEDSFLNKNYPQFESLMLRAQKPELIIKYYQDGGMWVDALRVCRQYLPAKLPALQAIYDEEVNNKGSKDAAGIITQARQLSTSGEYNQAVDCYMQINPSNTSDKNIIVKAWREVVELATKFLDLPKALETAKFLCSKLLDMQEHALAAQLYIAADMIKEAIDIFINIGDWNRAKKIASEMEPTYEAYVDDCYKESLRNQGQVDRLLDVDVLGGLALLAERGQWQKCLAEAAHASPQVLNKYVALNATQLIKDGLTMEALELYTKYPAPALPQNFNIYKHIAIDVFSQKDLSTSPDGYKTWAKLQQILYNVTENMKESGQADTASYAEFEALFLVSHYHAARAACQQAANLEQLVAKLSISLLRHSDIIPPDRAYYEAGMHARAVGRDSEAFVFLNHLLDLTEAIEEGNTDMLDYSDFADTDFPTSVPFPASPFLSRRQIDDIREWILAASMDQKLKQVLPVDDRQLYPAALSSPDGAGPSLAPCVVTGFPVVTRHRPPVEFTRRGYFANRDDWNTISQAAKVPTNSYLQDVMKFIERWCGQATASFAFTQSGNH